VEINNSHKNMFKLSNFIEDLDFIYAIRPKNLAKFMKDEYNLKTSNEKLGEFNYKIGCLITIFAFLMYKI